MSNQDAPAPRPAATVVLCRETGDDMEIFMVVRHHQIDFSSGALVFKGGKHDEGDQDSSLLDLCHTGDNENTTLLPFKAASIREAYEESGILIAREQNSGEWVTGDRLQSLESSRDAINASELSWLDFLQQEKLAPACDQLVHFAHWITPNMMPKRFDTHFFAVKAPDDHIGLHDGGEMVDSVWISPKTLLQEAEEDKWTVIFPTKCNVQLLEQSLSFSELEHAAQQRGVIPVEPWLTKEEDSTYLCIPEEAGYPVSREKVTRPLG